MTRLLTDERAKMVAEITAEVLLIVIGNVRPRAYAFVLPNEMSSQGSGLIADYRYML